MNSFINMYYVVLMHRLKLMNVRAEYEKIQHRLINKNVSPIQTNMENVYLRGTNDQIV